MARLTVVACSAFSIIFLSILFNPTDGVPFKPQIDNESSDGPEVTLDTALMIKSREKRDIMESMVNTTWSMITWPFRMMSSIFGSIYNFISTLVMMPINFIGGLIGGFIDFILTPFRPMYQAITWFLSLLYSNNDNPELEDASNNSSSSSSTEDDDESSFLERLELSLRDWAIDMAWKAWDFSKESVLPRVDDFIVTLTDSSLVSDSIRSALNNVHSLYQMLHMLKIL